jgi:acetoacetyl-CoA synthetase
VPVPRTARFSDLGGDSLRAARMFGKVEQQLGFDRPVSLLLQAPTVAELAVALRHTDVDVWSPLVAVREDGDGAPLFIVHGAGGDVMFAELVANGLTQPRRVYGLRPSVLSGRPLAEQTIEELASTYLAAMRTVQPTGPYALFGYSLGARIAYEIGRQARAAGDEISLLALGDAAAPGVDLESVLPPTATRWRRRIAEQRAAGASPLAVGATLGRRLLRRTSRRWLQRASTATAEQRIDAHLRRSETVPPALRNDFSVSQLSALSRRYTSPGPVDFPLLLIRTNQVPDVPDLGWSPLTPELLSEHVPCVHLDLVREPHVTRLAGILDRHLARSADHAVAHR